MRKQIDLNADVGESFGRYRLGRDEEVIPLISSANIACGFHAGDPGVMRRTVALGKRHGVALGAHPGFPDLLGFGRRYLEATLGEIGDYVTYQVGALGAFAAAQGMKLQHVKAHGALYNAAERDPEIWETMAEVLAALDRELILVAPAGAHREKLAALGKGCGIRVAFEFFADRAYRDDGTLVSRREPGAVIEEPQLVTQRVLKMVTQGRVSTITGGELELAADTICIHGDNPRAIQLAGRVRETLAVAGIEISPLERFL